MLAADFNATTHCSARTGCGWQRRWTEENSILVVKVVGGRTVEAWLEASQFSASDCGSKIQWPRLRHPLNPGLQARRRKRRYSFQVKTLDYVTLVRLCGSQSWRERDSKHLEAAATKRS